MKEMMTVLLVLLALLAGVLSQSCDLPWPKNYIVYQLGANEQIVVDGKLDEPAWTEVPWTDPFQDIQGPSQPTPRFDTFAKMRWDENYLYIGGYIEEPQIWANQTQHDSVIFYDNDFEVFTDPNWSNTFYKEFEMNALNTTWDLYLNRPYMDGGSPTNNWDIVPILTGVFIDGEINNPNVVSKYWTVEIAFPFKSLGYLQNNLTVPPQPKDQWRINFSRVEYHVTVVNGQYEKVPNVPEDNWVWSSMEVINMHIPERWGIIQFSNEAINTTTYTPDPYWTLRSVLLQVYYAEREFQSVSGYYTPVLAQLNLAPEILAGKCGVSIPTLSPTTDPQVELYEYVIEVIAEDGTAGYINQTRAMWLEKKAY